MPNNQKGLLSGMTPYLLVISARVLMASLMSAAPSAASAYIADTTSAEQRVAGMGRLGASRTLGAILGPATCGILATIGLLTPLYIGVAIALVSTILLVIVLREPPLSVPRSATRLKLKLLDKRYFPYIPGRVPDIPCFFNDKPDSRLLHTGSFRP
jgi:MFS family permease